RLDGRVVAVAGYFDTFSPRCPPSMRYLGPLEHDCAPTSFADAAADAQLCSNGACRGPRGVNLQPFLMPETAGTSSMSSGSDSERPVALVLIGHAADLRQWQCTPATQERCADAFVVDRVAWSAGHDVPLTIPETGDFLTGDSIAPSMTLQEVLGA